MLEIILIGIAGIMAMGCLVTLLIFLVWLSVEVVPDILEDYDETIEKLKERKKER